jgi:hypothetical protein
MLADCRSEGACSDLTRAIVAVVVALALALVVLAAILSSSGGDSDDNATAPPPTETGSTLPTLDPVFDEIDRALEAQPLASAAFNAPTELRIGDSAVIQLLLSLGKPISDLQAELTEIGEREGARVRVAPLMEARLTGGGFRIEALTPERQPVGRTTDTEWRWEVEGTEGGSQRLHLSLSALITVEGERTPRAVRTFDQEIEIRVTFRQRITGFIGDNWQWLWAALVVPLLGLAAGLVRSRRHRREEEVETSYVQGPRSRTWHWCRNCSNYPSTIGKTRPTRPSSGLCNQCTAKEADKNCRS